MKGHIPDRLAGKTAPDAMPEELDQDLDSQAEGELYRDVLALTERYRPALGKYAVVGVLATFLHRYQQSWFILDMEDEDDAGEEWKRVKR